MDRDYNINETKYIIDIYIYSYNICNYFIAVILDIRCFFCD